MSTIDTRIDPFTTSPNRQNPATFSEDMDTRLAEENSRITQMNDMSSEMNVVATEVNTNANTASTKALEASNSASIASASANYKGLWIPNYNTVGYPQGVSVGYSDGFNYVSNIANNLTEPTSKTNTPEWNWIETINPADYYDKAEADGLLDLKAPIDSPAFTGTVTGIDYTNLQNKPTLGTASSKDVGTDNGDVMEVGAFGLGKNMTNIYETEHLEADPLIPNQFAYYISPNHSIANGGRFFLNIRYTETIGGWRISAEPNEDRYFFHSTNFTDRTLLNPPVEVLHTGNTTVDGNGFIKEASPTLELYTDKIVIHNEDEFGATPNMQRLEKGVYQINNTLGLRANGWYIETPEDRNGNKYFNVEWEQNIEPTTENGIADEYRDDIVLIVKVYTREWNPQTGYFENGDLIDINDEQSRFINLRFNELKRKEIEDEENS